MSEQGLSADTFRLEHLFQVPETEGQPLSQPLLTTTSLKSYSPLSSLKEAAMATKYKVTCMKATCRYTESYERHPGSPKCPKCGSAMTVHQAS